MLAWIELLPAYGHGGLIVTALAALAAILIARTSWPHLSKDRLYILVAVAGIPVLIELVLTTWYLYSPTYLDHIEASTASATQYFRLGIALYPDLSSYTFHGLLYGPLLAEVTSVGYWLGSGVFASKLIGWAAAWTSLGLLAALPTSYAARWQRAVGIASVFCVLTSFGGELTADRADSLLLLCATAGFFCVLRFPGLPALAAAAMLAGAAADLKLHGPAYLVPTLYWWASQQSKRGARAWLAAAVVAGAAALLGISLPFLPSNVTLSGYLSYLALAARHGLVGAELGWNCAFLLGVWALPGLILLATRTIPCALGAFAAVLAAVEVVVAIIAAKPGAGIHHLLPFLGYHAFLLERMLGATGDRPEAQQDAMRGAATALTVVLLGTAWPAGGIFRHLLQFDLQLPQQEAIHTELTGLADRYPHGMLGVSDATSYPLTSYRPWLTLRGTRQTDYGALMDLKLSGVSDRPLELALASCEIPYLFMPKTGAPFSVLNRYGGPLFSDAVREKFLERYSLLESGTAFNVYACNARSVRR